MSWRVTWLRSRGCGILEQRRYGVLLCRFCSLSRAGLGIDSPSLGCISRICPNVSARAQTSGAGPHPSADAPPLPGVLLTPRAPGEVRAQVDVVRFGFSSVALAAGLRLAWTVSSPHGSSRPGGILMGSGPRAPHSLPPPLLPLAISAPSPGTSFHGEAGESLPRAPR